MCAANISVDYFRTIRPNRPNGTGTGACRRYLLNEAQALRLRLDQVKPFSLTVPMVAAAQVPVEAGKAIDRLLREGVRTLDQRLTQFIGLLQSDADSSPAANQRAFAVLKLRFNSLLDQLDIFADVISQRSEHSTGVWLSGLDVLARDALQVAGNYIETPPLVCYLDRGHGAAIRRTRTRLPGGDSNPVAVIRVPRERMVSHGIASSLVHEVGHQGAASLGLLIPMRLALRGKGATDSRNRHIWAMFERWVSEILSDFWAVATVGIGATTGLMGVVSLPHYFVFRTNRDDPHPFPWIRVKISLAFGRALFPDQQWERLERMWESFYPVETLPEGKKTLIRHIETLLPEFVRLVLSYRPVKLKGKTLAGIFPVHERQPERLREYYLDWLRRPRAARRASPSLVFAVLGQARADSRITARKENAWLQQLLTHWAKRHHIVH